ncbi:MAG: hypothetical protein Q8P67_17015 [archaeon]|nr:hypothetical protein [archaeon]
MRIEALTSTAPNHTRMPPRRSLLSLSACSSNTLTLLCLLVNGQSSLSTLQSLSPPDCRCIVASAFRYLSSAALSSSPGAFLRSLRTLSASDS